jgi:hypothetical protein
LSWSAPGFGQIRTYYIWRALGSKTATNIDSVTGTPPAATYKDFTAKTNTTYSYFVTSALGDGRKSSASNIVTITVKF